MFDRQLGKVIKYNLDSYEGEERLYALTSRMARALIQTTEYLRWNARHMTLPSDLPDVKLLGDWVDNLDERLMLNVNPLENLCAALSDCSDEILQILSDGIDGTNDSDTAKSLRDMLNQYITNVTNNTGSPLNPSPIETDTLRKLFGECVQIVEYTHDIWGDVLEQLEIVTNNEEFLKHAIDSIPFFKFLTDALPVDGWLDDIDYFIEIVPEEFESGYTVDVPDGSKWKMACKIYCACKDDKKITVDRIYNAFVSMLSGYTIPNFDNLEEWLSSLLGVNDNSELVTYALYSLIWGVARLSSFFGNVRLSDSALKLVLKIGEQNTTLDPNDYCEDCTDNVHTFDVRYGGRHGLYIGIDVVSGQSYRVRCEGTIYYDLPGPANASPSGVDPANWGFGLCTTAHVVAVIARIGTSGTFFEIGSDKTFTADSDGQLLFTINEYDTGDDAVDVFNDNSGVVTVTITNE